MVEARQVMQDRAASLVAIYQGTERERDVGTWEAARDAGKHVDDYAPKPFLFPKRQAVEPWFGMSLEQLTNMARANPELFGSYRNAVLDYEGQCAKQLAAVIWSYRELCRLADRALDDAARNRINAQANPLGEAMVRWGMHDDVMEASKARGWVEKQTRRYDLLPLAWRYV